MLKKMGSLEVVLSQIRSVEIQLAKGFFVYTQHYLMCVFFVRFQAGQLVHDNYTDCFFALYLILKNEPSSRGILIVRMCAGILALIHSRPHGLY